MIFSSYLLKEWLRICVCFHLILLCYLAAGVWGIAQSGAQGLCGGLDHCHQSASGDPHLPPAGCAALEGIVLAYKNQNDWLRAYSLVTLGFSHSHGYSASYFTLYLLTWIPRTFTMLDCLNDLQRSLKNVNYQVIHPLPYCRQQQKLFIQDSLGKLFHQCKRSLPHMC